MVPFTFQSVASWLDGDASWYLEVYRSLGRLLPLEVLMHLPFKSSSINYGCQGNYIRSLIIDFTFTHGIKILPRNINIDSSWTLGTDGWDLS